MTEPDPTPAAAPKKPTRREAVFRLRRAIDDADPGALAALRKYDGESLPPPVFYRLTVDLLDDQLEGFADVAKVRDDIERRWAVLASAMAQATGFLSSTPLGEAMAKAGVAEMRLLRLLEANPAQLPALIRNVVHQLVQKGQPFDPNDIANLVLGREGEKAPRSHIARTFYRHEGK